MTLRDIGRLSWNRAIRLLPAAMVLLLTTGCVSTHLAPISAQGARYEPLPDEVELWDEARAEEDELYAQVRLYDDPALDHYIAQVVDRLEPPGLAANQILDVHVVVVDDPTLHAYAFPHGAIWVHSGLLAQMDNEHQLAAVLAHEMTHIENRHMARHARVIWNKQVAIATVTFATSFALAVEEVEEWDDGDWYEAELAAEASDDVMRLGWELATEVRAEGYGRKLEAEADGGALRKLRAAGYDLGEVMVFYDRLQVLDEYGDPRDVLAHGLGADVAERMHEAIGKQKANPSASNLAAGPLVDDGEFTSLLRPVLRSDVAAQLDDGNLELAAERLERLWSVDAGSAETRALAERLAELRAASDVEGEQ